MKRDEEVSVVNRVLNGDKEAFRLLLEAYDKKVYGFIYKIVHDSHISQDLTQETFIKVYKKLHTYDQTKEFSSWLFTIAKNETFKHLRKRRNEKLSSIYDNIQMDYGLNSIEDLLERKEIYQQVCRIIDELPRKYKDVIILKYLKGLSYKEISVALNISEKKVESWLYLARKKISKEFKKYDYVGQVRSCEM